MHSAFILPYEYRRTAHSAIDAPAWRKMEITHHASRITHHIVGVSHPRPDFNAPADATRAGTPTFPGGALRNGPVKILALATIQAQKGNGTVNACRPFLLRKQLAHVLERFELQRVTTGIQEEHRRLLPDLTLKPDVGLYDKLRSE
jgi:hypothetical protein